MPEEVIAAQLPVGSMWPMVASSALRRLSSRLMVGVMLRRPPEVALETTRQSPFVSDRCL